jgi:DNA-binding response OmpR family regulator
MTLNPERSKKSTPARVLVIEDEPKLRQSLAEGLEFEEWNVITAATGAEALDAIGKNEFDLVVLDWMLPDVDGLEVLRRVRMHERRLPVLMMTARCGPADQITAFQNGATDFIGKPFAFDDLLLRCRRLLAPALGAPS